MKSHCISNQGAEVVQRVIATQEVSITIEEDNELMSTTKATPLQWLPAIFQKKIPFLEMYQRLVQGGQ
jgi:hypothetical protein